MSKSQTRVVVTGLGATTPLGGDVPSTWSALLAGESGAVAAPPEAVRRSGCVLEARAHGFDRRTAIETAIGAFEIDNGRYPSTQEGLDALLSAPADAEGWRGPYLTRGLPKDPWGNEYVYRYPGQENPDGFDLYSMGPDGREGNDDIGNWSE